MGMTMDATPRRWRLLPKGSVLGWTPYAWLLYLPTFVIEPIARTQEGTAGAGYWTITVVGLVAFLAAYFRGFWVRGRELLLVTAFIAALAIGYSAINVGACVLFVYAASFAGNYERPAVAARLVVLIALLAAATAVVVEPPLFYWITSVAISLLVGGVNLHFAQEGRSQRRLRLAQEEVEHMAAVAERERIARDLHDVLGHTLSLIILKSELASRLAETDAARAGAEMRDVEDVARRTLQDVREAIRGYRATLQDEAARAQSMLKAAAIRGAVDVPERDLPVHVEETLALTLREAVTNVVRHSGATNCTASLTIEDGHAVLRVEDDGRGAGGTEGAGLRGMRERVEAFGGSVARDALVAPGRNGLRGTTLVVALPLHPAPRLFTVAGAQ
jgi:two-component system sensor histidine kinase DesK